MAVLVLGVGACGYRAPLTAETYDPYQFQDHKIDMASVDSIVELYQIMKDTHEVFTKCQLPYWAEGGTLLGAIRNQGIIPWDDDNDTCILSNDIQQLLLLKPVFEELGYFVEKVFFGYRIVKRNTSAAVDIFVMKDISGKLFYDRGDWGTRTSVDKATGASKIEGIYQNREEIFPLKEVQFGPIQVMIPGNSIPYLDAMFRGWNKVAFTYGHAGQRKFKIDLNKFQEFKGAAPLDGATFQPIDVSGRMKNRVPDTLSCPVLKGSVGLPFPTRFDGV